MNIVNAKLISAQVPDSRAGEGVPLQPLFDTQVRCFGLYNGSYHGLHPYVYHGLPMSTIEREGVLMPWAILILTIIIVIVCMIIFIVLIIMVTRPKPAYGRQGLAGSWGQDTDQAGTF